MGTSHSKNQLILLKHCDAVNAVAFSPDGQRIATGSTDENAIIWDISNGEIIHTLRGHTGSLQGVAWNPSGDLIMTGSSDRTARIWQTDTGALLKTLNCESFVLGVMWSPTGEIVATAGVGRTKLWNPKNGQILQTTQRHGSVIHGGTLFGFVVFELAFSPDGKFIATVSDNKTAKIFPVNAEPHTKPIQHLVGHSDFVRAVAWSPTGDLIATGSDDKTVRIWDWDSTDGNSIRTLIGHSHKVHGVAWSPNGDFIISGSVDRTARIWNAATGDPLQTIRHHNYVVTAVAWSSRGDRIATASSDSTVKIVSLSLPTKEEKKTMANVDDDEDWEKIIYNELE